MATWIALLRGINVSGRNTLPMAGMRDDLAALPLADVRTSIQSGNVVFSADAADPAALAQRIATVIEQRHGFRTPVLVLHRDDLLQAIAADTDARE